MGGENSGRPKIYEDLTYLQICVNSDIKSMCISKNINMSEVCRKALIAAIGDPELIQKYEQKADKMSRIPDKLKNDLAKALKENIVYAKGWVKIIKDQTGVKLTEEEIINWFNNKFGHIEVLADDQKKA